MKKKRGRNRLKKQLFELKFDKKSMKFLSRKRSKVFNSVIRLQIEKYSKTCVKQPLSKRPQIGPQISFNAGQKYCRMLQGEHSAILSTYFKLPFIINIFVLSIFEWQFFTGFRRS